MENMWEDMHAGSMPMREVTYIPGIDTGENFVAPLDAPSTGGAEVSSLPCSMQLHVLNKKHVSWPCSS